MSTLLRVLVVEDVQDDALLSLHELKRGGYAAQHACVATLADFSAALAREPWDVILSDYGLAGGVTGLDALEVLKASGRDIPFILISGTIGEERAVQAVKRGSADFVPKGNLSRLVAVVERELRATKERAARRTAEAERDWLVEELQRGRESLQEKVEARTQELTESLAKLTASNDLVTLVTQNVPGLVFRREVRPNGGPAYRFIAGSLLDAFRLTPEEVLREPEKLLALVHPDDKPGQIAALDPANEDLKPRNYLLRAYRPDRVMRWIEVQTRANRRLDGTIVRDGLMTDITPLKEAEAALAASEARLRRLVNNVPGMVFRERMTRNGNIAFTFFSDGIRTLLGFTPQEAMSDLAKLEARFHPDEAEERYKSLLESAATMSLRDIELRFLHPDGTEHWLHVRAVPHPEPNGDVEWDGIAHDVTDRRRLEDSLRHTERLQAMAHLTDGVAHHFNNLLTIIAGRAEILEQECASLPRANDSLQQIGEAVSRGARLIQQLRQITKPATPGSHAASINELLDGVHNLAKQVVGGGVELVFDPEPGLALFATADSSRLQVAVLSLVFNARDALPEGGRIVLGSRMIRLDAQAAKPLGLQAGPYVQISVKDNGMGMAPDVLERAINPFFTTKPIGQGIGLGLSMVHGFAQQSGGTTTLHSTPGAGTEVRILLPVSSGRGSQP